MRLSFGGFRGEAPAVLWVFGALAATVLAFIGVYWVASCGGHLEGAACPQLFAQGLPRAMWSAYFCVGAAALFLATSAFWKARPNTTGGRRQRLAWACAGVAIVLALVAVVALREYYVFAIVAVHWLILRTLRPRSDAAPTLLDLCVIFVSWVAGATIAWALPLGSWLFGTLQSGQGWFALVVFAGALLLNVHALRAPVERNARTGKIVILALDGLALLVFVLLSFRQDFFSDANSTHHWGFFVGPAELVRQGGWLLWDVPSQYGFFNMLAIAVMPFASVWTSMYVLDAALIFASACMLFFVLRSLRVGRFSIAFSFLATLVLVFLIPAEYPRLSGPQYYPSVGALRFIWVESLILILLIGYAKRAAHASRRVVIVVGSVTWLFGVLWSAESAIYVTVIWIPSLVALIVADADGGTIWARVRGLARPPSLFLLCLPLLLLAAAALIVQLTYVFALGHGPDYFAFYEFGVSYGKGFGAYPINGFGAAWMLLFSLAVCVTSCVLVVKHSAGPRQAIPLLYAASAAIWVTASYFIARSADSNVTNISTPIWLAIAAILFVLDRERMLGAGERYVRFAVVAPLTVAVALTVGDWHWMSVVAGEIRAGYRSGIPGLLPQLPQSALSLLDRAHAAPSDPMVFEGVTLLPEMPADRAPATFARRWVPANPSILLTVIPASRRAVYFERFTTRRPMEGWYLRAHSAASSCENFDSQYVTSKHYETADWDVSWCSLKR